MLQFTTVHDRRTSILPRRALSISFDMKMDWFFGIDGQGTREFNVPEVANQGVAKHHRLLMVTVVGIITTLAITSTNSALWKQAKIIRVGVNSYQEGENFACHYTPKGALSSKFDRDHKTVCSEEEMAVVVCEKVFLAENYTHKEKVQLLTERGCSEKEFVPERRLMSEYGVDPIDACAQTVERDFVCEKIMTEGNRSDINQKSSNLQIWAEALPEATCVWCLFVWGFTLLMLYSKKPWLQRLVYYILVLSEAAAVTSLLVRPLLIYVIPQFLWCFSIIFGLVTFLALVMLYMDHCYRFCPARRQGEEDQA